MITMNTALTKLFGIEYPIVQAGMVYMSGAKLAAASANAGCLGVLGAGSMDLNCLDTQLTKLFDLTDKPVAVNLPLLYSRVQEQAELCLKKGVRNFITSAGSPAKLTPLFKSEGCKVVHVTSHPVLARKCEIAGVDAVIVEGFEAGGHNGRDELTTLVLLQQCRSAVNLPLVAAGGIGSGAAILGAIALGASGVQIGTLFAATVESSGHANFKNALVEAGWSDTELLMKKTVPVRLLRNAFSQKIKELEDDGAGPDELNALLGKGRARLGMLEGNLEEGELEIGQIVSQISGVPTVAELVARLVAELAEAYEELKSKIL